MPKFPNAINVPAGISIPDSFLDVQRQIAALQAQMMGTQAGLNQTSTGATAADDVLSQVKSASGRKVYELVADKVESLSVVALVEALYGIATRTNAKVRAEVVSSRQCARMADRIKRAVQAPSCALDVLVVTKALYAIAKLRLAVQDDAFFTTCAKKVDVADPKQLGIESLVQAIHGMAAARCIIAQKPLAQKLTKEIGRRSDEVSKLKPMQISELLWGVQQKALHKSKDGNDKNVTVVRREIDDDKVYNSVADRVLRMKDDLSAHQMVEILGNFAAFGLARRDVFQAFGPKIYAQKSSFNGEQWKRAIVAFGRFGVPLREAAVGPCLKRKHEVIVQVGDYVRSSERKRKRDSDLNIPQHMPSTII